MKRLGINMVHLDTEEILEMGLSRVEFVLARNDYTEMHNDIMNGIKEAEKLNIPYSIHLPIFLYNWYEHDYLSAFYLDPGINKRELSFRFLRENLEKLKGCKAEYYIIHFSGLYKYIQEKSEFDKILNSSLKRLNDLAKEYDITLLLEYFGSNYTFSKVDEWIDKIIPYSNLEILCDTGHLYFSSIIHKFDFYSELEKLAKESYAFHIWTTKGEGTYFESEYYKKYHHIVLNLEQIELDGFVFDTKRVLNIINNQNKPIIIEASEKYYGRKYLLEGIKSIVKYFNGFAG